MSTQGSYKEEQGSCKEEQALTQPIVCDSAFYYNMSIPLGRPVAALR